jgi:hypothetical protein
LLRTDELLVWGGAPAGIEPATPSLPSMVGPLRAPGDPLLHFTTPKVKRPIGDRVVGYREAGCGAAAGNHWHA